METNAETQAAREAAIDALCARLSFSALPTTIPTTAAAGAAVAYVLSREVPAERLWAWLAGVALVAVARIVLWRTWQSRPRRDEEIFRFLPAFTVIGVFAALWWGSLVVFTDWSTEPLVLCTTLIAIGGMASAGAISNAGTPRYMVAVILCSVAPPVLLMLASGSGATRALLVLVAGHLAGVLGAVRLNYRNARETFALRFENADLARRLAAEKELELAARQEAEQANQEKSRFLAAASHDARQPLHALGLFVDTLKAQPLEPRARHLVANIDLAQRSLVSLHEGLLDLSSLDVGSVTARPRPVRVRELLRAVESESAPRAKQKGLALRVAGPDVTLFTDPALALRVLRNLVANALKYTEHGRVLVAVRRRGSRALVQVWDTGIGIAPEQHARIFDELYQVGNAARDRQQGLGLGLSIVKRLAGVLGSGVSVRSVPGRGSVFSFELPLAQGLDAVPDAVTPLEPKGPRTARGQVVLLVDDDGLAREALGSMLEHWGYEVIAAQSAEDALDYAAQLERLDVVVTDLWLPGRSGLALLEALAASRPGLARVVVSGDTSAQAREQVAASGAAFILKPVRAAALQAALEPAALAQSA